MSFEAMIWVLNHSEAHGSDRLVLLAIASHQNGQDARPGSNRIAREAGLDPRSVFRCLARLEASGELQIDHRQRDGNGVVNRYRVATEPVDNCHQICCHPMTESCLAPLRVTELRLTDGQTSRAEHFKSSYDTAEKTYDPGTLHLGPDGRWYVE